MANTAAGRPPAEAAGWPISASHHGCTCQAMPGKSANSVKLGLRHPGHGYSIELTLDQLEMVETVCKAARHQRAKEQ